MSVQPDQSSGSQPADSEGRFSTLIGSLAAATSSDRADRAAQDTRADDGADRAAQDTRADDGADGGQTQPVRPAFTARASGPATIAPPEPANTPQPDSSGSRVRRAPAPDAAAGAAMEAMDEPLLGDAAALRARWQRVQASFVDGPQEAVGDAADLIEQTAQALIGALRQQQRQLGVMWESGAKPASSDGGPASGEPDTEHLRLMMQRYRALFNQLCRP